MIAAAIARTAEGVRALMLLVESEFSECADLPRGVFDALSDSSISRRGGRAAV